jgi:hypothetical protein
MTETRHIFDSDPRKIARSFQYYIKRQGKENEKKRRFGEKETIDRIESKYFKKGGSK